MQARMPGTSFSPLPIYAAAFLAGVSTLFSMPSLKTAWILIAVASAIYTLLLVLKRWRLPVFLFLGGIACAGLFTACQLSLTVPQELAGKDILVEGYIEGLAEAEGRVLRFTFNVLRSVSIDGKQIKGRVRVSDYRKQAIDPRPGEAWRLLLRVKPPHGFSNPAGFDYEKWLFSQRIVATAYIRNEKAGNNVVNNDYHQVNHRLPELDRPAMIDRMRLDLGSHINRRLAESSYIGIITALTTGDRRAISSQQWSVLQKTGTSHLMAISGLHVGLVAGIVFFLFRFIWSSVPVFPLFFPAHKAAIIVALLVAAFYSLMAGFSLPTQRALLMLTILSISLLLSRRVRPVNILSLTLLVVLVLDPLSILSAGFWLSFSAVAMILYALLHRRLNPARPVNRMIGAIHLQWKLSLMIAPATLIFFQHIPLAGPVANLIAIPVVAFFIVPLVLLASLSYLAMGSGYVDQYLYQLAEIVLDSLWLLLDRLAVMADALSFSPNHSLVAMTGLIFAVLITLLPAGLRMRRLAFVGLLVFLFPSRHELGEGEFRMIVLDVGQGLSVIVMTAEHTLLFDTGARFSERFNAGDAVVLPVLKSLSVRKVDAMIISHGDNDHSGGAKAVLAGIQVQRVISNENFPGINVAACHAGQQWRWDRVSFRILHPARDTMLDGNNASCVLQIQSQYGSVLLPADIEEEAEEAILLHYPDSLASSILLAPHHGSKTSSSEKFIDAIKPGLVIFPAGWMNRYQHPAEMIVKRFTEKGIDSVMSGECGAIIVQAGPGGISVDAWRQSNKVIWDRTETDRRCRKVAIGLPENPAL
jgi:competence protein ComEC